jgi:1-deoxy-D-xylulose-5-phosphate synthase
MATQNIIPVVAIYSTFIQRAFDQIIHDVALQKLHVVFVMTVQVLVGADGPTHHGSFDISFLRIIPWNGYYGSKG